MKYKIGDKVRIVNYRTPDMNDEGLMDKYFGTVMTIVMTIEKIYGDFYLMEEDDGEWCWNEKMIEGLATSDIESSYGHLTINEKGLYTINW